MKRAIVLFISMFTLLYICTCGTNTKKTDTEAPKQEQATTKSGSCADFASQTGKKLQSAIVLDFVNKAKSTEFEYLSEQIADNLYRDINRCFSVTDNSYVRNYIKDKGISSEKLADKETAREIGIYFGVNIVIYGTFTVTPAEIQIIGEISSVEKAGTYNDFRITGKKEDILTKLTELSAQVSDIASSTFPPEEINEKLIVKEATSVVTIIKIVEKYQKGESVSTKSTPKPDSDTVEEVPSPRPKWTWQVPEPDNYIYFIGQAMEQADFNSGLDSAIQDCYLAMSRAVGKKIESVYKKESYSGPKGSYEEITGKLIVKTLNYVRGDQMAGKYYRKLKSGQYEVCVLFKLSWDDLKKNIAESVSAEAERLKEASAIAETEKLKAQIQLLKMLELQKQNIAKLETEKPKYEYTETKVSASTSDKPSDHLNGQKDKDKEIAATSGG